MHTRLQEKEGFLMLTNAYDFDQHGHLIHFDPMGGVVPFPQKNHNKQKPRARALPLIPVKLLWIMAVTGF
jgi:hypothetical protein